MEATQTANPPSFESVWAALQELTASQKETDRQLKETKQILKEQAESSNNRIGSLTNLFGDVTEAMIAPKICEKFEEFGFKFLRANPNVRFNDKENDLSFEVDIMLENGDKAMLIEVKTKLTIERVDKHIERLEKMHNYANLHGDKRIFLGAVAGIVVTDEIREYALSQGFYFIEYAGENFYITSPISKPK
jgi:predicted AAA+ superfamily ATPase